jgi:hypothetical protein
MTYSTPALGSSPPVGLRVGAAVWEEVNAHVLRDDNDEHGGVLLCGVASANGSTRLLARRFMLAVDGTDYVPGERGYRALTAAFVRRAARDAAKEQLVPLFVHGHGRGDSVAFSVIDMASHERGYPALLDICGTHVGALVIASHAVAGDVWMTHGGRAEIHLTVVVGSNITRLTPRPTRSPAAHEGQDRQVRLFGEEGQEILRTTTVGVVGVGGAGMITVELLSRLGIGRVVAIDPDRVEITNLPRLPGATSRDALTLLTASRRPEWLRRFGKRHATPKVKVAQRMARTAGQGTVVEPHMCNVRNARAVDALKTCDYIVLAADSATARHIVNIIGHQYLIPIVQVGVMITPNDDGTIEDLFAVERHLQPGGWCLRCSGLVLADRLAIESMPEAQRRFADYGTGQPAPSVITLNAIAVSHAITQMMLSLTGLMKTSDGQQVFQLPREVVQKKRQTEGHAECPVCGTNGVVGLGDLKPLPLPMK